MKKLWNSFKVAFAMFSKVPMPRADWTKENMQYMFLFFPLVGVLIGVLTYLVCAAGNALGYEGTFISAVMVLVPLLVTGGIHIDGLLDTSDALSSWGDREKRLRILKDSHAGAFAIITCCISFLLLYGSFTQFYSGMRAVKIMSAGYALSRCLSGFGVLTLPKANEEGTVAEFSRNSSEGIVKTVLTLYMLGILVLMWRFQPVMGPAVFGSAILWYLLYRRTALKYFGGTSGDLSGFFLCICEVTMAVVLALFRAVF